MKKFIFCVLFFAFHFAIVAEEEGDAENFLLIDLKGLPSSCIDGCVNVITGNFTASGVDLVVQSSNPITLSRSFNSCSLLRGDLCDGWSTNLRGKISMMSYQDRKQALLIQGGSTYTFKGNTYNADLRLDTVQLKYGVTNCHSGFISAKNNLKNIKLKNRNNARHCYVDLSKHETLTFYSNAPHRDEKAPYFLKEHTLPNRCRYEYSYDKYNRKKDVYSIGSNGKCLGQIHYVYPKNFRKNPGVEIHSSDGKAVIYKFKWFKFNDLHYISEIISDHLPHQKFEYSAEKKHTWDRLVKCSLPDGRYKTIDYYKLGVNNVCGQEIQIRKNKDAPWGLVAAISGPVGTDENPIRMYSFLYDLNKKKHLKGSTTVFDAKNNKSVYHYSDEHRLTSIENFLEDGALYRKENIIWGSKDTQDYTNLIKRSISNSESEVFSREYVYDKRGNVIEEIVKGGIDCYSKKYSYNEHDQLISEDDGYKLIKYSFVPESDLLRTKFIISANKIKERYYFEYDNNGALTKEFVDDGDREDISDFHGVTVKYIKYITPTKTMPIGFPEIIDEKVFDAQSHQELLVKKTINTYSKHGYLIKQQHFDQDLNFTFDLEWDYDLKGNLIWEKDAIGSVSEYQYDANNNCIFHQGPDKRVYHVFVYDFSNRLVRTERVHEDGNRFIETYSYDYCGNKVSSTDSFGHTTHYAYDSLNRLIETNPPVVIRQDDTVLISSEKIEYDVLNNVTSETDRNGNETKMTYSLHSKPISIEHPDGAKESFIYRPDGILLKALKPSGSSIEYTYDYKDRKISERYYAPNGDLCSEQKWNYSAFQFLSETDRSGMITYYSYDSHCRLCKKVKGVEESLFFYDSRGRQIETWDKYAEGKYSKTKYVYDDLNQIIEESIKDQSSQLSSHKLYEYDINGNRTSTSIVTTSSRATKYIEFDANNQPIKIIEPSGEITHIYRNYSYIDAKGQSVLYEETVDPMGTIKGKTFDPNGMIVLEEIKSSYGELLRRASYCFDGCGKLINRNDDHIVQGICEKSILTCFEYDSRGQEVAIIEAAKTDQQKVTRKQYGKMGELIQLIKPDGVNIHYKYDYVGRLIYVQDDVGQIYYQYSYDLNDNVVNVLDIIRQSETLRTFDSNNRLIEEILDNGLKMKYQYDALGRITKKIFPDQTSVDYVYNAKNLITISRDTKTLSYDYDLSGRLTQIVMPNNLGEQNYFYDNALRFTGIKTPYYSQTMSPDSYDELGRLQKYSQSDSIGMTDHQFGYDQLNQIISEEGDDQHKYAYDSRFNRTQKDGAVYTNNDLNQLLSQSASSYDYDRNGNRKTLTRAGETFHCTYDSLNRLISVTNSSVQVTFQYDVFNRRMQKSVSKPLNGIYEPIDVEKYIYEGDDEIGSVNELNQIKELKILGPGATKSAAIIELCSEKYIPIHDHRGDVATLVQVNTGAIAATYRYSAFGEERVYNATIDNPWRFSGKRVDVETGWNFIGHRYYDSEVARWITPDPLGFADGPNLYAYVHNSPILFVDPTGLYHAGFADNYDKLKAPVFHNFERFADLCINTCRHIKGLDPVYNRSRVHIIEGKEYSNLTLSFVNGVGNSFEDAVRSAEYVSHLAGGAKVILIYNASHGILDGLECALNTIGIKTTPALLMQEVWDSASKRMGENGNIMHVSHSQGCILTDLTSRVVDNSVRQQISATLVAPPRFILDDTFGSVGHIGSSGDIVKWADPMTWWRCPTYEEYDRHPSESDHTIDHRFESQTFYEPLGFRIEKLMDKFGCF